jgi:hypothetical protein
MLSRALLCCVCRNNTSDYYVNNKRMNVKEVTTLLKSKGIDLDNNRFLILQVQTGPSGSFRLSCVLLSRSCAVAKFTQCAFPADYQGQGGGGVQQSRWFQLQ